MEFETDGLYDLDVPDGYDGESIFDDDDYPIEDDDYDEYDPDPLDEEMGGYDDPDFD